jgi:hypothetical protein
MSYLVLGTKGPLGQAFTMDCERGYLDDQTIKIGP